MTHEKKPEGIARLNTWVSRDHWAERIICFNASWFVTSMGTGVIVQVLENFPYPAQWLHGLAYCFWVLEMVLFVFYTILSIIRSIQYPHLTKAIVEDFYQTSFLGAIPVTVTTISSGVITFYGDQMTGVWIAYGLYWAAVIMSLIVGGIFVFIACAYQDAPELSSVNGVWLLTFIPCIVTASTGSLIVPHLPLEHRGVAIIVTFLIWALGITMSMIIITYYFWRLMRHKLPVRDEIVSCFIPVGPPGMGAYSIHNLSIGFAAFILERDFALLPPDSTGPTTLSAPTATLAVAASVHWLGILTSLMLISFSTFWLLQSALAMLVRVPKRFNVGFWSFVFPNGVYANAMVLLGKDLDNRGLRGWGAAMGVVTILLWCLCAAGTVWKGVWCGELFFAPGLEGWNERRALGIADADTTKGGLKPGRRGPRRAKSVDDVGAVVARAAFVEDSEASSAQSCSSVSTREAEMHGIRFVVATERTSRPDGTYALSRSKKRKLSPDDSSLAEDV